MYVEGIAALRDPEPPAAALLRVPVHRSAQTGELSRWCSEVLVTHTVQMLVPGSGISFAERGLHTLKGVRERQLFAVERS